MVANLLPIWCRAVSTVKLKIFDSKQSTMFIQNQMARNLGQNSTQTTELVDFFVVLYKRC